MGKDLILEGLKYCDLSVTSFSEALHTRGTIIRILSPRDMVYNAKPKQNRGHFEFDSQHSRGHRDRCCLLYLSTWLDLQNFQAIFNHNDLEIRLTNIKVYGASFDPISISIT